VETAVSGTQAAVAEAFWSDNKQSVEHAEAIVDDRAADQVPAEERHCAAG
jgi:hypothetical protein